MGKKAAGQPPKLPPHVFEGKRIRKPSVRLIESLDVNGSKRHVCDEGNPEDTIRKKTATGAGSNPYSQRSRKVTARFSAMTMVKERYEHSCSEIKGLEKKHSQLAKIHEVLDVNSSHAEGAAANAVTRYAAKPANGIASNPYSRRLRNVTERFSCMRMVKQRYEHGGTQGIEAVEKKYSQPLEEIDESHLADRKRNHPIAKPSPNSQIIKIARPVLPRRGLPAQAVSMAALAIKI